jgi:hypothetical protein
MHDAEPRRWFFFDEREEALVEAALACVRQADPGEEPPLAAGLDRLHRLAEVLRDSPPIAASWPSARRGASLGEALIDLLCRVPDYDLDLHIPTKAVVGQAYVVAKINLFKALGYALEAAGGPAAMREACAFEVGQAIHSKMAEELFLSIITDPEADKEVKVSAGRFLLKLWEERLLTEIDDLVPLLESTWHARDRVRPVLGTMLGAHEVARLLREGSDERFLDHFLVDDVPDDQIAAFEEFLFGLPYEHIVRLRAEMVERSLRCVSPEEARRLLGVPLEAWASGGAGPQVMYTSYKQRRVAAAYRSRTGAPGPKKTAEEYVMTAFLKRAGAASPGSARGLPPSSRRAAPAQAGG